MKKFVSIITLLFVMNFSVNCIEFQGEIYATSAVLYDINGNKLVDINGDEPLQPASVTKIMTMLLIMEQIDNAKLNYDDMITVSEKASSYGGTQVYLKEGEQMSVDDMLKAIAVASANDAAVAMAEHIAGSHESFVNMMNAKAQELGMVNTVFVNANGLDSETEITLTTANDIAIASVELLKYSDIVNYTNIWMDTLRDGTFGLSNTNKMLKQYLGMYGLKTGYTTDAGYCISAVASRDGLDLIAVVMQEESTDNRTADISTLLNYGFANYKNVDISYTDKVVATVYNGKEESVNCEIVGVESLVLENTVSENLEKTIQLYEDIKAPVMKGDKLGSYIIQNETAILGEYDIVASENVEKLTILDHFVKILKIYFMKL